MKRGRLERKTELRRDGDGARRFANSRSALNREALPDQRRTVAQRKSRPTTPDPITPEVDAALRARSGGYCEARAVQDCSGYATHRHHRKLRRHGDHTLSNLLHVCTTCHDAIHGPLAASRQSYIRRWLLHAWDDPAAMPPIRGLASVT